MPTLKDIGKPVKPKKPKPAPKIVRKKDPFNPAFCARLKTCTKQCQYPFPCNKQTLPPPKELRKK